MASSQPLRWTLRDWLASSALFLATAAFVLWQNSRLAILWDLSYLLDSSQRIALGQHPYRDFPFVHPPLTFLLQAAILRLTGRVYFHHILYAAAAGALATVLTWRIALHTLIRAPYLLPQLRVRVRVPRVSPLRPGFAGYPWLLSLLLTTPLTVLGIYSIFPHPFYDCDCILAVLVAVFLLQRLPSTSSPLHGVATGVALVVPLFFKQNIGLPFLLSALAAIVLLLATSNRTSGTTPSPTTLFVVLAGALAALLAAALLLHLTAGLHNYLYWTIHFAAQRRLPGLRDMLSVFDAPALLWQLPCVAIALTLLARIRTAGISSWPRWLALTLLTAPFLWTLLLLPLHTDPSDRADDLLALWPLLLLLAAIAALVSLGVALHRRTLSLSILLPLLLLATIFGTMLSQQLWGSTYAIWPLLVLLLAGLLAHIAALDKQRLPLLLPALATIIAATLLVCGALYAASAERLSYAQLQDGPLEHSTTPALRGMATRGPWLPAFDQLLRFAAAQIPPADGVLLLPGEDPFYFATGRTPRFPVLLFDNTTDPDSPPQIAALTRSQNIRWLIVKRNLQLTADPMPQRAATLQLLAPQFTLYRTLDNYNIYRRR
jgi:hypothetical protein